ncbi:MAG: UvrD-helicase domain-containing protein [Candidatus Neomarinimicrobiota bacterium]|nr:UvrD-helicase domain-containing protein [Candidatus Neomarinimicrobiota bacterium]
MNLKKLNDSQKAAVEAVDTPVLIFAGAGSGKTRVLTYKISYLIKENIVKPEEILAVTFTNKAAGVMKQRVSDLLKGNVQNINIGTFHSICAKILRNEIRHLGFTKNYAIYDASDQISLIKVIMAENNLTKNNVMPKTVRNKISSYKSQLINPKAALKFANNIQDKIIVDIYKSYNSSLKENNAVDFDDLLNFPLEIFNNHPRILGKYQKLWKYILVDEYQDTNKAQFLLVKMLAEKHRNICVVGDDDQSIYAWRGADIRNILDFEKDFPECETFTLENNYRSTNQILQAAQSVVRNNLDRVDKDLLSVNGEGDLIGVIETHDEMEEADAVINALQKEIKMKKRTFNDFSILYRTNSQSRALEDSFRRNAIPYKIIGGTRFYERKEVKDVLGYLRLIVNKDDTISLRRVINFPPRGIGLKTVDKCYIQSVKDNKKLFEVLNNPEPMKIRGKQGDSLLAFYKLINKYNQLLSNLNASELARALVEEVGILKFFKDQDNLEDNERYDNVLELLNSIDEYMDRVPGASISDFLEEVSLLTDIDEWNHDENYVTMMTVHASKGLEFPVVFLTGLEDGLFPLSIALNEKDIMEEERRLFYVALTRSQEMVYLLYATDRRRSGSDSWGGIASRFIKEIPEEFMESISFSSAITRKLVKTETGAIKMKLKRTITTFDDFKVGDSVEHSIFGEGKIMALSGSGENQRVGVAFKDGLKKKLIVKFAKLKKIS